MASVFSEQRGKLIIAGVIFLAAIIIFFALGPGGGAELTDTIHFVCVATGKFYDIDRDEIRALPMVNPDTGQATLLPYVERDGRRYITRRRAGLLLRLKDVNRYVDTKTLEVRAAP